MSRKFKCQRRYAGDDKLTEPDSVQKISSNMVLLQALFKIVNPSQTPSNQ